jgi:hypothetical protein
MLGEIDLPEVLGIGWHFLCIDLLYEGGLCEMSLGEGSQYQHHRPVGGAHIDLKLGMRVGYVEFRGGIHKLWGHRNEIYCA